jgi:hypothetical protein
VLGWASHHCDRAGGIRLRRQVLKLGVFKDRASFAELVELTRSWLERKSSTR